ncbi:hypothetical protein GKZ89_04565 [Bacillus mangrovi]|uniref:Diphthamide synthase domain-containing protein n=1 Tax=Metabacillus mangrovi TaxID=1491830 RepID=A0A7X2S3F6_9BACI|nr:hypothetical protein [Metabacillus mangrovi]
MKKTIVSWSGGKDSAIMLERLTASKNHSVMELFTSISAETGRVPFHGIPHALLEQQAASLDFPIRFVKLPPSPVNKEYEEHMKDFLKLCKKNGAEAISYGDLFQEDIRKYREQLTEECGL